MVIKHTNNLMIGILMKNQSIEAEGEVRNFMIFEGKNVNRVYFASTAKHMHKTIGMFGPPKL